jgi:hypothetical protein
VTAAGLSPRRSQLLTTTRRPSPACWRFRSFVDFGAMRRTDALSAGSENRRPSSSWLCVHLLVFAQGRFQVKRKTRRDRMRAKLKKIKAELRQRLHQPIPEQGPSPAQILQGFYNYSAVPTNMPVLRAFRHTIERLWVRTLRSHSQKYRFAWDRITKLFDDFLPKPKALHPWPQQRFAVRHSR